MDLVWAMVVGAGVYLAGAAKLFTASREFHHPGRRAGQERAPPWCQGRIDHGLAHRRSRDVPGARHQPGLSRRRLHHRPRAGCAQLRRRPVGLGPVRAAADVPAWGRRSAPRPPPAGSRPTMRLGRPGSRRLEIHRASHRRGRNARRSGDHAVQDAQEPRQGHGPRRQGPQVQRRGHGGHQPPGPRHEHAGGLRRPGRRVPGDDRRLLLVLGERHRRHRRRHRDGHHGFLLRGRLGQPGRHDRLLEQPHFRPDALDLAHRRAV